MTTAFFLWYFSPSFLVTILTTMLGCSQWSVLTEVSFFFFLSSIWTKTASDNVITTFNYISINTNKHTITTSMISSRADFFFFSALESKLEDASFLLTEEDDAEAFRALAPRTELTGDTKRQSEAAKTTIQTHERHWDVCTLTWRSWLQARPDWKQLQNRSRENIWVQRLICCQRSAHTRGKQTFFFFALTLQLSVNWIFLLNKSQQRSIINTIFAGV